jgi:hypothetical protein
MMRGLILAAVHVALVAGLGGKLLYERHTLPREWVETQPVDPDLPLRGRYVQLRLVRDGEPVVPFFIPEHARDPSRRAPGESLWVEVTLPERGPPRPIRLGVRRGDGPIELLDH